MKTIQDVKFTSPDDRRIFFNVYSLDFVIQDVYDRGEALSFPISPENEDVEFHINPDGINFRQERLIQKVQTGSSRYQLLDWGPDVLRITADSKTGSFLIDNLETDGTIGESSLAANKRLASQNKTLISYEDIISGSTAFKAIEGFTNLFRDFDASKNFMIVGIMERAYRGYLQSLSIRKQADSPWQWTFAFEFVVIESSIDDPFRSATATPSYDTDLLDSTGVENIA